MPCFDDVVVVDAHRIHGCARSPGGLVTGFRRATKLVSIFEVRRQNLATGFVCTSTAQGRRGRGISYRRGDTL